MISTSGHLIPKFPEVRFHRTRIFSDRKTIFINTIYGVEKIYGKKLDDIEEKLKECKITFLRIHKSILVNFLFVTKIAKGQVILKNKVELPMSENGYKNIQKRFDGEDICNIDLN